MTQARARLELFHRTAQQGRIIAEVAPVLRLAAALPSTSGAPA
ncbi:MAG: hypothetical protein ACKV2O_04550 [Acidimicrobiales bacterium]